VSKGPDAFRTISEAAEELAVAQHVLRFWETKFSFIRPMKRAGGRRFYRRQDIEVLRGVRILLHQEGYTIKGVQRLHKEHGLRRLVAAANGEPIEPPQPILAEAPEAAFEDLRFDDVGSDDVGSDDVGFDDRGGEPQPVLGEQAQARLRGVLEDLQGVKDKIDQLLGKA
jgi:DNA-binding transcriptional MerR regulator